MINLPLFLLFGTLCFCYAKTVALFCKRSSSLYIFGTPHHDTEQHKDNMVTSLPVHNHGQRCTELYLYTYILYLPANIYNFIFLAEYCTSAVWPH